MPTGFGAVLWGDVRIFVCVDAQGGRGEHGVWISIFVDDVDAVYARCRREGLEVTREPVDEVWGVREFHVRHPDGHIFRIGTGNRRRRRAQPRPAPPVRACRGSRRARPRTTRRRPPSTARQPSAISPSSSRGRQPSLDRLLAEP